jgi:serine/threonine-protein kinase
MVMQHPTRIGKYEIEQFLGGGMSHVYRAKDTVLGRRVAVKVLTEAAMADPEAKSRFLQEARLASNIQHENIIAIFDFGEDPSSTPPRPFMVMEFVEGESLRSAIEHGRAGDTAERLRIARQAARALEYIHTRKVVHRDIKPENIHIDRSGKVRLMDFGIAGASSVNAAKEGDTAGTPFYMAPEQVLGRALTEQSDIYSFGVVLFELFTGVKPFQGETVEKVFEQILYQPADLQLLLDGHVPSSVTTIVARCTSKKLMDRPASMSEVVEVLQQASQANPVPIPKSPEADPGVLSPSAQRPESHMRLSMPPPPSPSENKSATAPATSDGPKTFLWVAGGALAVALVLYAFVRLTATN